ncbi:NACHT domain-containing protein [Streptomyces sp. RerS4]|uniref:NACHT domain-containing protein n=1 Tax=Streptomyces sp. RerS4 TaxID=2942449 RepID=UPI0024C09892|nr:NACHT domain-containing protein [Streptomyces sp. RerS4]
MSAEAAAINLGRVLATRAVSLWLEPRRREQEAGSSMGDLIRVRVKGLRAQNDLVRQFEKMGDAVSVRLEPLLANEFAGLEANERQAALDGVTDTFVRANLSDEAVIGSDADATVLARRIRDAVPAPAGLSEAGSAFHDRLFDECVRCYVQILKHLPVFTERAVAELLARTTSLASEVARVLERLYTPTLYAPLGTAQDEGFRQEYLRLISDLHDEIELYSFASERAPRTKLSVAYVSLRTGGSETGRRSRLVPTPRSALGDWAEEDEGGHGVRVETALGDAPLVLLRGEAGSGKSTLLKWLAVTAARGTFTDGLAEWNRLVPVLIKLRRFAGKPLPEKPEAMMDHAAGFISGHMPKAWLDRRLRDKQVLFLVDGVDELPTNERRAVRTWLRDLVRHYPGNRIVVTSRPAAAGKDWLRNDGFQPVLLDRMRPSDLVLFIRQWHQAVREQGDQLPCEPGQLPHYESSLITALKDRPHLASLASSPLLAAMLCALHLEDRRQLPRDRMELYRRALGVLLHVRDSRRHIPGEPDVELSLTDKQLLLQDLAWWLSDTNRSEITQERAVSRVRAALGRMRHLDKADADRVFDRLLQRCGVLRAPAEDRVDFLHRTFQEYLAAAEAVREDRIGNLVERAHLDQWRETIVMAAGHAYTSQQVELIEGILARAAAEPRHRRRLRLLATSCLETMPSVPDALAGPLDEALDALIPPRRTSEAESLAVVGTPVLRRLPTSLAAESDAAADALVRTTALIGGDQALKLLEGWAQDPRVHSQLAYHWEYFDAREFTERVLKQFSLRDHLLFVDHPKQCAELASLPTARRIAITYPLPGLADARAAQDLSALYVTNLRDENDLSPLRLHPHLRALTLGGRVRLRDVSVLNDLPDLMSLRLTFPSLPPISEIPLPQGLTSLQLSMLGETTDFLPLAGVPDLISLTLGGSGAPANFTVLHGLTRLMSLELEGYDLRQWPGTPGGHPPKLTHLWLTDCVLPDDLGILAAHSALKKLHLTRCRTADSRPPDLDSMPEGVEVRLG